MLYATLFAALPLVSSVLGLAVTSPTAGQSYAPNAPITLSWSSVESDKTSFEAILIDPTQKLVTVLDQSIPVTPGSPGSIVLDAPASGWPVGVNWTIDAMSTGSASGILAQSGQFDISTTGASVSAQIPTTLSGMSTVAVTASQTTEAATITSAQSLNPTGTSGALGFFQMSGTLVTLVVVMHAFML